MSLNKQKNLNQLPLSPQYKILALNNPYGFDITLNKLTKPN